MKSLLILIVMFSFTTARASIEYVDGQEGQPTTEEIARNRACFEEVAQNGCGDPGEEIKEFRLCLHNVFSTLSADCKKMMSNLYYRKN